MYMVLEESEGGSTYTCASTMLVLDGAPMRVDPRADPDDPKRARVGAARKIRILQTRHLTHKLY